MGILAFILRKFLICSDFIPCRESPDVGAVILIATTATEEVLNRSAIHNKLDIAIYDTPTAAGKDISVLVVASFGTSDGVVQIAIILGLIGAKEIRVDEESTQAIRGGIRFIGKTVVNTVLITALKEKADIASQHIEADATRANIGSRFTTITTTIDFIETSTFDDGNHAYCIGRITATIHIFHAVLTTMHSYMGFPVGVWIVAFRCIVCLVASTKHLVDGVGIV